MRYDIVRANVLLKDLESIAQGQLPGVELTLSPTGDPPIRGMSTRVGLFRLGIRIARAALTASSHIAITGDGRVGSDSVGTGSLVQIFLTEDAPEQPVARRGPWIEIGLLAVTVLTLIGAFTVVKWIVS